MDAFGPASESLRLSEHYRQLTDDELIAIALDTLELTEMAQQALATEVSRCKLTIPRPQPRTPPPPPDTKDDQTEDPYAEDRQVVQIATVWSLPLQALLDQAEVPFFMGKTLFARSRSLQIFVTAFRWELCRSVCPGPSRPCNTTSLRTSL